MLKRFTLLLLIFAITTAVVTLCAQPRNLFDQLVSVNAEWRNQQDVDPEYKRTRAQQLNEVQLIQLHLVAAERLIRKRDIQGLPTELRKNRLNNLDVLHNYAQAGVFPINNRHVNRQPYFIDDNNTYCAVGYLMKESGGDHIARAIHEKENFSYLKNISNKDLGKWAGKSGLSMNELALIQPSYPGDWPTAIIELHYNNTGQDINEFIEIHESTGTPSGMAPLKSVNFYNGNGTIYKTVTAAQMQTYYVGFYKVYYYPFPASENFSDSGKIEIMGAGYGFNDVTVATTVYNSRSVQVSDYYFTSTPVIKTYNVGESESTPINTSLTYCGFYYDPSWTLQHLPATPGTHNTCTIMPVGLAKFSYTLTHNQVVLNWETLSEQNNEKFIIERSANGIDFAEVGSVRGRGNSNAAVRYSFSDPTPREVNHYRLKQVDLDGKFTYSKILYVKVQITPGLTLLQNVVTSSLTCDVPIVPAGSELVIYDITGRKLIKVAAKSGMQQLYVAGLQAGKYIVCLTTGKRIVYNQSFMKQ